MSTNNPTVDNTNNQEESNTMSNMYNASSEFAADHQVAFRVASFIISLGVIGVILWHLPVLEFVWNLITSVSLFGMFMLAMILMLMVCFGVVGGESLYGRRD